MDTTVPTGAAFADHDDAFLDVLGGARRKDGNLYVCGPGGIWILSAEGEKLGIFQLPEEPHNLARGDADARSLYVTA
jgi:sugar lactone lactonase YvrE